MSKLATEIVILAAGAGKRMNSNLPKVLHKIAGKSMIRRVIDSSLTINPTKIHIICSETNIEQLKKNLYETTNLNFIIQEKQLGTANAVQTALPYIHEKSNVLVLCGDVPLINQKLLAKVAENQITTIVTTITNNPTGFGRVARYRHNKIASIIEEKDCTKEHKNIKEIYCGIMLISKQLLLKYLPLITNNNNQNEFYLTDIVKLLSRNKEAIDSIQHNKFEELLGVNTKKQLAYLERYFQTTISLELMEKGLTIIDPKRFDIRGELQFGKDVEIDINVILEGNVDLKNNVKIGSNVIIKNSIIGENSLILPNTIIEDSIIGSNNTIGPFARIRPNTKTSNKSKIGNFVEIKKSEIGINSKISHLSYIGDSSIGNNVNIGAGTITCNYDGVNKYKTIIEDGAFIGSNCKFIAPVTIGENATIGAGSTITNDAPNDKLTLERSKQITVNNWKRPTKK